MIFYRLVWSAVFITLAWGWGGLSAPLSWGERASAANPADETPATPERPTLSPGDSGPLVRDLQIKLKRLSYYSDDIDGEFDAATQAAVETFQQDQKVPVTGVVDAETWRVLADPVTAQIEAAIKTAAQETAKESSETTDSPSTTDTESTQASPENSSYRLLLMGIALGGIGIGGIGLWQMLRPGNSRPKRVKRTVRRSKQRTVAIATEFARDAAEETSESVALSVAAPTEWVQSQSQSSPDTALDMPPSQPSTPKPLPPHASLTPPPPPSMLRKRQDEAMPLTPTSRLARIDIIETLIVDLQSPDSTKRRKAIWELGQRADSRAIQPLVNLMGTSDSRQRSLILGALSEIGSQTLKPMKRALAMSLQDSNAEVRKNAIRDLTRIYDLVGQISHLLSVATEDQDGEVRETAQWALGQLNRIRSNANRESPGQQQLLQQSISPPETFTEELHFNPPKPKTELN